MSETFYTGPAPGGAGTEITGRDGSTQVSPNVRGTVVLIGPAQKGKTDQPVAVLNEGQAARRLGRHLSGTWLREAARGFLAQAAGAGRLLAMRVAAATSLGSPTGELRLYDRDVDCGYHASVRSGKLRKIVFDAIPATPGEWAGPAYYYGGKVSNDSSAISGQDFTTGKATWAEDELVGCTFRLDGLDKEFTILGNTAAGMLSLDGGFTSYTTTGGAVYYRIYRTSKDAAGQPMELAVRVSDDPSRPLNDFALTPVFDKAAAIKQFVALDADDLAAVETLIESELDGGINEELALDISTSTISDGTLPQSRPANWVGIPVPKTLTTQADVGLATVTNGKAVQFKIWDLYRQSGSGTAEIVRNTVSYGADIIPHRLILTWSDSTNFTVAAQDLNGKTIAEDLPAGTKGAAWASPYAHLGSFTVASGSSPAGSDVYILEFRPFPADLVSRNPYLYVSAYAAAGRGVLDPTVNYRVIAATADTLTLATNDTLTTAFDPPRAPQGEATTEGPYDVSAGSLTLIYTVTVNGKAGTEQTLTCSLSGGSETVAAVVADLNTQAAGADDALHFYVTDDDTVGFVVVQGDYGADVSVAISGTIRTVLGFATSYTGTDGAACRLEYNEGMRNARAEHDGITNLDYTSGPLAVSDDNALAQLIRATPGLVHVAIPGNVTPAVQQALIDFCEAEGAVAVLDLPDGDSIASEEAAAKWVRDNLTVSRFHHQQWPAWGYTSDTLQTPGKLRKVPLSGDVLGAMVRYANSRSATSGRGWHKAPGGARNVVLSSRITRLDRGAAFGSAQSRTRDHVLNNAGILPIMQDGSLVYVHGDQGANALHLGTFWLHKQKTYLDIIATLRARQFADLEYEPNPAVEGSVLQSAIEAKITALLEPFYNDGALDPLSDGDANTFANAIRVDAGAALNPQSIRDAGKRVAQVEFRIVNTTKVISINLFTNGISVPATAA